MSHVDPKVAVLIPVYNGQEALLASLRSLSPEIEARHVFVVDDGSIPAITAPDDYAVRLIRLPQNQGIVAALNAGLECIVREGYDFVARLDAGDLNCAGRLAQQTRSMSERPALALLGTWTRFVDVGGSPLFDYCPPSAPADIRPAMHINSAFCHPAVMMRVDALQRVGFYDPAYETAEDYELFMRLMQQYEVANLAQVLVLTEANPNGISRSRRDRQLRQRLRIQLRYFDAAVASSYVGLARTLAMMVIPGRLIERIKAWRGRQS